MIPFGVGVTIAKSEILATLGLSSGQTWTSKFLNQGTIAQAYEDPSLSARIASTAVARQAEQWQMSQKFTLSNFAPVTGIASDSLAQVLTLAPDIFAVTRNTNLAQLRVGLARVGIGAAMTLLSATGVATPIVAAIGAVAGIFQILTQRTRDERVQILPPADEYRQETDEFWTNEAVLRPVQSLDWTQVFMPRFSGPWRAERLEGGKFRFRPESAGEGSGMIPGSQQMTSSIQLSRVDPRATRKGWYASDVGSWYPGASQCAFSLSEISARAQTQLYSLDTVRIEQAWRDYYGSALDFAARIFQGSETREGLGGMPLSERRQIARVFLSRICTGAGGWIGFPGPWNTWAPAPGWQPWQGQDLPDPGLISTSIVTPWAKRIRERQSHFLGTVVGAAYTSADQPAFASTAMRARLEFMRAELLRHPALRTVDTAAIIDPAFKTIVFDRVVGATFGSPAPKIAAVDPFTQANTPNATPEPPQGGVPFGSPQTRKKQIPPWAVLALLAAGGVALSKR